MVVFFSSGETTTSRGRGRGMAMPRIVITSINARYTHTNLAIRYLYPNLGDLQKDAQICEFIITDNQNLIVEELLTQKTTVVIAQLLPMVTKTILIYF